MPEQTEMTFWDHLEALRRMILRCLIALGIFLLLGFAFIPYLFDHVVMAPCQEDFFLSHSAVNIFSFPPVLYDKLVIYPCFL